MPVEKKKEEQKQTSQGILDYLRSFNLFLEGAPMSTVNFFDRIFKTQEGLTQTAVDMICRWAAWKINIMVERRRQEIIRALYNQNSFVNKILAPIRMIKNIYENPLSVLGAVAAAVKQIASIFLGPFITLVNFIVDLTKELIKIVKNLAKIMEVLPPNPPPGVNVNFDEFKLEIGKMGLSTVLDDPSNLKPPEEMFPEPIVPFSPAYFSALGSEAKSTYRKGKPFYSLKQAQEDYKKMLDKQDKKT